jgi:uncharacterized membrane protein YdjX (TVP38/TMEM64 family)
MSCSEGYLPGRKVIQTSAPRNSNTRTSRAFVLKNEESGTLLVKQARLDKAQGSENKDESDTTMTGTSETSPRGLPLKLVTGAAAIAGAVYFAGQGLDYPVLLEGVVDRVGEMGPAGYIYFAAVYILAEVLAVPAFPLTASSGYLFGLIPGFLVVLASATIAAGVSFLIGRTFLRETVQEWAKNLLGDRWDVIDTAVGNEGFKVVLLLRLSPLLPFALSNYLYGITSVDFVEFMMATFLGFSPGTFGIVYAGSIGKDLFSGGMGHFPWYVYAGAGFAILLGANLISRIATSAINEKIEPDSV